MERYIERKIEKLIKEDRQKDRKQRDKDIKVRKGRKIWKGNQIKRQMDINK